MFAQVAGQLHFNGTAASDNSLRAERPHDHHDGVVERTGSLFDVLGSTTADHNCHSARRHTLRKHVESFVSELNFLELAAISHDLISESIGGGLNDSTSGFAHAVQVFLLDTSRAEDVSVCEVLRGQITHGQLGEDNFGARCDHLVQLVVDNFPLSVNNFLEIFRLVQPNLCVVLLSLQFEFNVEAQNLGVLETLGLLLETGVGESLAEGDTLDQEGVFDGAAGNFLDANVLFVEVLADRFDGVHDHFAEEFLLTGDNLGVK